LGTRNDVLSDWFRKIKIVSQEPSNKDFETIFNNAERWLGDDGPKARKVLHRKAG
jgi:hypothetical protein